MSAWRTVFLMTVAVYLISVIPYLIVVTADVQEWNNPAPKPEPVERKTGTGTKYAIQTIEGNLSL